MPDLWMTVDAALSEVPVNIFPLVDDVDFKTRETGIAYNESGMDLVWNFVTTGGAFAQTAVTPTTSGDYDWNHQGDGMYTIEIPASSGVSINNDSEGFGWFTGVCDGVLPWRGPTIGFRSALLNDSLINGSDLLKIDVADILATVMTESYAAEGAEPTIVQALYEILQFLKEKAVSGTTVAVKKLDQSTTAATYTLDDATNPTSITRAT